MRPVANPQRGRRYSAGEARRADPKPAHEISLPWDVDAKDTLVPYSDLYEYPPSKTIIAPCDYQGPPPGYKSNMVHLPQNKHLEDEMLRRIAEAAEKWPKPDGVVFEYGTAGFRMKASLLDSVVFRMGLLAELRSRRMMGKVIGVMITASHNPAEDNGVKLVDPMGEMMNPEWEKLATRLCNAEDADLGQVYMDIEDEEEVSEKHAARVVFARDTRASGHRLAEALKAGLGARDVVGEDFKYMTTPQLHYIVRCYNTLGTPYEYGEPTEKGYYEKLAAAWKTVMAGRKTEGRVVVDCANGVGGPKLHELIKYLPKKEDGGLEIKVVNDDVLKAEALNYQCGADFVKTNQRPPPSSKAQPLERCCSLDGDADRLIYYYLDEESQFKLLDGDRIATLSALFLADLTEKAGLASKLKIGIVQTAYANGASTDYISKVLKLSTICTPTGVKHLHHAATRFDIGVYFEANGHGTIVFSDHAISLFSSTPPQSPGQRDALASLTALTNLINQAVGDALSDMLFVEVILSYKSWGPAEWITTYTDLPSRLVKVNVSDRGAFRTTDAERRLVFPEGIQERIDDATARYHKARAFARASGTEDAVRVYAEAATKPETEDLAKKVADLVKEYGGLK